jgi:DNA segregation ATPase FtsK/SpoIIIE-like protein
MDQLTIDRPPRIQPKLPFDQIEIPSPPGEEQNPLLQLLQVMAPLVMIVGMVFVTMSSGGGNPWLIIPMSLAMLATTAVSFYTWQVERQRREAAKKAYADRLLDLNTEMHTYHDLQRRFYVYNYPDAAAVYQITRNARSEVESSERTLRAEARLWERRTDDDDFGVIRLGMGTLPSTVLYTFNQEENFEDPLTREAMKLRDDSAFVDNIPVILSLRTPRKDDRQIATPDGESGPAEPHQTPPTPTAHALTVAGEQGAVYEFMRALLGHYVVFHQPADARLYLLGTASKEWGWTAHLPHCKEDQQGSYRCFLADIPERQDEEDGDEEEADELERFLEGLRKVLSTRKIRLNDRDNQQTGADPTLPFLLLVVDLFAATYDDESKLSTLDADAAISILLDEGDQLGAAVIFLVPERAKAPSRCSGVIEIQRTTPATNSKIVQLEQVHFRYAETGVNSYRYVGVADSVEQPQRIDALGRRLAELTVRQGFGANVPSSVPFLELMNFATLEEVGTAAWSNWQKYEQARRSNWLRAKIGLMSGNKARQLVFSAKGDGVHGMVAGSTGSGKSELLISLISALAVTYAPAMLNFVLVDYKGGGAFKGLDHLPHVVDIITNLQRDGVTRMFTAITAEMQRRQALNTATNTKNIVDYRQKGLHLTGKPYPFLFIIIDEFAEMIADRPEYKTQLESITRVGRAQGVSLILAAQRPSGVTDQMRSNIKFRICLRVETTGESREMLRREDAAYLPGGIPGRGYLQVGNDEIELIQIAYTGDKYIDPAQAKVPVIWPGRRGYSAGQDQEPPELYKAIVDLLAATAGDKGLPKQRAPWPSPLPLQLSLAEPLIASDPTHTAITSRQYLVGEARILLGQPGNRGDLTLNPAVNQWLSDEPGWLPQLDWQEYALRPVVGLVDDPVAAKQFPLVIDLPVGHYALFGASGWGKTTFLRTLIISLAATHSPDQLHVYVLDLGGRALSALRELPHVGGVIIPDEEGYQERVEQLMRQLAEFVEQRKTLLAEANVGDIYQYNAVQQTAPAPVPFLPAILVAIDNFIEFKETFGNRDDDVETAYTRLIDLARQAKPYGIHFVITAGRLNDLPNTLYALFTERLTLKLSEPDYRIILGAYAEDFTGLPGRGYVKVGQAALSFQIAQAFAMHQADTDDPALEARRLAQFAGEMHDYMAQSGRSFNLPVRIDALPSAMLLREILIRHHKLDLGRAFWPQLATAAAQNWQESLNPAQADWLKVTLGVISGDRLREMHFEAKRDGVHGLIAGGTGSGKSELLMTLLVGLALNYDPSVLNFVLVDYKGGGAFIPFVGLPHVVDIVTNLNKSAVRRMFTAINAEMQRRQKLNADTQTKDIVDYRQKGYHLSHEPYPHLFIIIDEYAEMISDSPEFKAELDSITRVGRAQGVNLLLAAQRPTGVTDQMRANIKYRICLRVEELETSREMLRRPDAALLPNGMPGRGYLQVGNETVELIQVAYTGETYADAELRDGNRQPRFYDLAVELAQRLLLREAPRSPWPPILPAKFTLSMPLLERYQDPHYQPLVTLGQADLPCVLNPFVARWEAGEVGWQPVDWNSTALRAIVGVVDNPYGARQLPLVIDFTRGHVVLFGASGWGKSTFLRTLVTSLAATHSPDAFHAHLLDLGGRSLEVLTALPQVGTVIIPDEGGYEERVQQLLRELEDLVDERKRKFSAASVTTLYEHNAANPAKAEPAVLIAIDNFAEFIETFGSQDEDETNPLVRMVALIRQGKAFGLHFIITAARMNVLSNKLLSLFTERLTLRLADADEYRAIVGGNVTQIDEVAGRGYVRVGREALEFQTALAVGHFNDEGVLVDHAGQPATEIQQIRRFGEGLRQVGAGSWSGRRPLKIDAMPKASFYRQVLADPELFNLPLDERFLTELQTKMAARWAETASREKADWLAAVLGIALGERKRRLHFSAKTDGVHGLIAGGTGSGKSELLMTLIVGLAVNYAPSILNFVLVDYKGGGAFAPFKDLPHCVDIVTNLNKAAVKRMFTAINAEMRRRQALNAETSTKDIINYREKGYHLTREPYPHLFIIIDEYAEMIEGNPEYRAELESITRVGRAQGVNLILASQRPIGVSDQMRANIKLRLCLRVEQTDTSHEMLRRPDAAFLPNGIPGRGYLQVGNENLELIQVSWSGEAQPDQRPRPVEWPGRPAPTASTSEETPRFFDAVVNLAGELTGGVMAPKPWPGFLPTRFSLQARLVDAQRNTTFTLTTAVTDWLNGETDGLWPGVDWTGDGANPALRPVAGLVDDPAEARQVPLVFNLDRYHLAIHGDSGMGKTALLRTLLVSLVTTHSPAELQLYVLDLGGRNYRSLEALPHMGAVIYADDATFEERLQRLFGRLERLADERQQLIAEAGATGFLDYNTRHRETLLPAVLVVIDNIAELMESHESLVETVVMPLLRRSLNVGVTFVASCNIPNNMPSKLYALFGERITLKQGNFDRYMDIVGRGAVEIDDIPGRGYIRMGGTPLMFQAALPVGNFDPDERDPLIEADELRRLAQHMAEVVADDAFARRSQPDPIHVLPEQVLLEDLLDEVGEPVGQAIEAVLGRGSNLQPARLNLQKLGPHFAVVGPPLSGKTTTLYNWIFSLAYRYGPARVQLVLVDLQRRYVEYGGEHTLADLPHVLTVVHEADQLAALVTHLRTECTLLTSQKGSREIFVLIDDFDDFGEELEQYREVERLLARLARGAGRDGLHLIIAGMLENHSDLRRQVRQANYGVGLRSVEAVDALGLLKRLPGMQDKELPVGRGYIVKAGQATLVQIATPYSTALFAEDDAEQAATVAFDLDRWVVRIRTRYADQQATWSAPIVVESGADIPLNGAASNGAGSGLASSTSQALAILKRAAYHRADADKVRIATWSEHDVLISLVSAALAEAGLDPALSGIPPEEILLTADNFIGHIEVDGTAAGETGDGNGSIDA